MNHLDLALAARSFALGRGIRSSTVRHRRLVTKPIAVVLWQLGAEPFSAAAIGWGDSHAKPQMAVAGEPATRVGGWKSYRQLGLISRGVVVFSKRRIETWQSQRHRD
jgi:hypothetical protein